MAGHARLREALQIAATEGAAEASRRTGVKAPTIRSAMARGKGKAAAAAKAAVSAERLPDPVEPVGGPLDSMRRARDGHRRVEAQAIAATEAALRSGDESAARNAAAAGGISSDKALSLDRAILAAEGEREAERARLDGDRLAVQRDLLLAVFVAVDLPPPMATLRELGLRAAAGEALEVSDEVAAPDRGRLRATIHAEVRAELLAEAEAHRLARPALPAGDDDDDGADGADDEEGELVDAEVVDAPPEMSPEAAAELIRLEALYPDDPGRVQRELNFWLSREAIREECAQREAADAELGEPSETEWRNYLSLHGNNRRLALQSWRMDRRPPGDGLAGWAPSRVAAILERPPGSR